MKSSILLVAFIVICCQANSQDNRSVSILFFNDHYENDKIVRHRKDFTITRDSIYLKSNREGVITNKQEARKVGSFAGDIYGIDEAHWLYYQKQSRAIDCDSMKNIEILFSLNGKLSAFNIKNGCFPADIRSFMEKLIAFLKEE